MRSVQNRLLGEERILNLPKLLKLVMHPAGIRNRITNLNTSVFLFIH